MRRTYDRFSRDVGLSRSDSACGTQPQSARQRDTGTPLYTQACVNYYTSAVSLQYRPYPFAYVPLAVRRPVRRVTSGRVRMQVIYPGLYVVFRAPHALMGIPTIALTFIVTMVALRLTPHKLFDRDEERYMIAYKVFVKISVVYIIYMVRRCPWRSPACTPLETLWLWQCWVFSGPAVGGAGVATSHLTPLSSSPCGQYLSCAAMASLMTCCTNSNCSVRTDLATRVCLFLVPLIVCGSLASIRPVQDGMHVETSHTRAHTSPAASRRAGHPGGVHGCQRSG